MEILIQKTPHSLSGRLYAQIGGNTLLNRNMYINGARSCDTYTRPLTQGRYRLFGFTYSIFIYVGTVDFGVHVDLGVGVNLNGEICSSASVYDLASGSAGVTPQVSLHAGGSASLTLLVSDSMYCC